jgi:hypothetical protein
MPIGSQPCIYGHRQLSIFFVPSVAVNDGGFAYKGKQYSWNDVRTIRTWGSPIAFHGCFETGMPGARIQLSDGRAIRLHGRTLEREGSRPNVGFLSSRSDAFDELVELFQSKLQEHACPSLH